MGLGGLKNKRRTVVMTVGLIINATLVGLYIGNVQKGNLSFPWHVDVNINCGRKVLPAEKEILKSIISQYIKMKYKGWDIKRVIIYENSVRVQIQEGSLDAHERKRIERKVITDDTRIWITPMFIPAKIKGRNNEKRRRL